MVCTISGTTITKGTDTTLNTTINSGTYISAVALSEDKVFIAYSNGGSYYLSGMICTISGTSITTGTDIELSTEKQSARPISSIKLSTNVIFIAHNYSNNFYLYRNVSRRFKRHFNKKNNLLS